MMSWRSSPGSGRSAASSPSGARRSGKRSGRGARGGAGLTRGPHPRESHRARLARRGVARAADLAGLKNGAWVQVAGAVVVRQRPGTAKGFVFLNLEDETGLANVIVRPALFRRHRPTIVGEPFLMGEGALQHEDGVISVRAARLWP